MRRVVFTFALLLSPSLALCAEPSEHRVSGDLAIQARDILRRHCAGCHDGSPDVGKSKLNVLRHEQLIAKPKPVPFVTAGGRSYLLELVKDGSMPPASRPGPDAAEVAALERWVKVGAPAFPQVFDDRYVLEAVADDFEREKVKGGSAGEHLRYASFAHLVRDGGPLPDIGAAERQLNEALSLIGGAPVKVIPIDPAATVFRIELSRLGWQTRALFETGEGGKFDRPHPLRPFDLILLEYPYAEARPAGEAALTNRLEKLLDAKSQVRPVPFVRGDWIATALATDKTPTPLAEDLRSLAKLETAYASGQPAPKGPAVLRVLGTAKRQVGPRVVEGRAPIPPLSGWYAADVTAEPAPFALTAELVAGGQVVKAVTTEQSFKLRVSSPDRRVHLLLLMVQADGEVVVQDLGGAGIVQAKGTRELTPKSEPDGFNIAGIITGGESATEYFVLFACEDPLPVPAVVRSTHAERPVWRFLLDPTEKYPFDPNKVVRRVIPIPVTRKKSG